jgi:hypothetical protein
VNVVLALRRRHHTPPLLGPQLRPQPKAIAPAASMEVFLLLFLRKKEALP